MHRVSLTGHLTPDRQRDIYDNVTDMSALRASYYLMVAISTVIAAYGLLANSAAVIIGAMLVAPLMGPIFGVSLGLAAGDRRLLRQSLVSEVLGVLLAVALACLIGLVPLREAFGPEILARTQPTLYDVIIALASGLAGAYALVDERISAALPGVAIATALVPPLAVCGLCLAVGRWHLAFGALLLFVANFLAIEIAAGLVFVIANMAGEPTRRGIASQRFLPHFAISLVALLVIGGYMTHTLMALIGQKRFAREVETALAREVRTISGAGLSKVGYRYTPDRIEVTATVLTPREFEPSQVATMQTVLQRQIDPQVHLVVSSLVSKNVDAQGPVFVPKDDAEEQAQAALEAEYLRRATQALSSALGPTTGAEVVDIRRTTGQGQDILNAVVRTPSAIEPRRVAAAQSVVQQAVGSPVRLIVRSVCTQDADAQRFIAGPESDRLQPLSGDALKLHRRLEVALGRQTSAQVQGAQLEEVSEVQRKGRLCVLAVVRTPKCLEPAQVHAIEGSLRKYVAPNTDLLIRSQIGGDASATGYVTNFDQLGLAGQSVQPNAGAGASAAVEAAR
jgi:uncharacterized hydrophobic protein (TIGR00271 family)